MLVHMGAQLYMQCALTACKSRGKFNIKKSKHILLQHSILTFCCKETWDPLTFGKKAAKTLICHWLLATGV